jgi:hypothetical protein
MKAAKCEINTCSESASKEVEHPYRPDDATGMCEHHAEIATTEADATVITS